MFQFLLIEELRSCFDHGFISFQTIALKSGQCVLSPPVLLTYIHRAVRQLLIKESSSNCQQHGHGEHVGRQVVIFTLQFINFEKDILVNSRILCALQP